MSSLWVVLSDVPLCRCRFAFCFSASSSHVISMVLLICPALLVLTAGSRGLGFVVGFAGLVFKVCFETSICTLGRSTRFFVLLFGVERRGRRSFYFSTDYWCVIRRDESVPASYCSYIAGLEICREFFSAEEHVW